MKAAFSTDIDKLALRVRSEVIATEPQLRTNRLRLTIRSWSFVQTCIALDEKACAFAQHLNLAAFRVWLGYEVIKLLRHQACQHDWTEVSVHHRMKLWVQFQDL